MKLCTIHAAVTICVAINLVCPRRLTADSWSNPLYRYMGSWKQYHKNSKKIGIGTASLIAPRWALTAYHVAQFKDKTPNGGSAEIVWPFGEANVLDVYHAPGRDIALIKLRKPVNSFSPVALLQQSLLPSEGNKAFTLAQRSGKYRRTGHATNGGDSFRVNGDPPGKAGDSGGPWVIERFGSLPDVQFAVLHGTGTAPQIGPISGWIDKLVGEGVVHWVTKSELNNGIATDTHLWTGNGSTGNPIWNNQHNWNSGGRPGVSGTLKATNHETAQLRWISTSKKSKKNTSPKLENNWSLGRIEFLNSTNHDLTVKHSKNWNATTGSGRKTIRLNGVGGQAFNVRDDADGTFTYTFQPGIRIKVDEDLSWDVYGDETLNIQGRVDGTGKIIKGGSGTLMFTNTGEKVTNTGSNPLEVLSGSVVLAKQAGSSATGGDVLINGPDAVVQLDQDEQIMDTAGLIVQEGLFDLNGKTESIGTLVLEGGNVRGGTLKADHGGFQLQGGTISSNLSGTGGLSKTTDGTVILSAANTYTGGTTIDGGTLLANNTTGSATGTGAVTVNSGGTLGGFGRVTGTTIVHGGAVAPGMSAGVLTLNNAWFDADSRFDIDLAGNGGVAGTDFDQLTVSGAVTINSGSHLDVSYFDTFQAEPGDSFLILDADTLIGVFDNLFFPDPQNWFIDYDTAAGNVTIGVVPEPATLTLLGIGSLVPILCLLRRRPEKDACPLFPDTQRHLGSTSTFSTSHR